MIFSSILLIAFIIFAIVSSITPGPNNTMLLISGVHFGFKKTLPHLWGVTLGFALLLLTTSLGLGGIFSKWPFLFTLLKYVSAIYLIYLAWKILSAGQFRVNLKARKPLSFLQAVLFQWANPKAWIMAIIAITTYAPPSHFWTNMGFILLAFLIFVFLSGGVWTMFGQWIQRFLDRPAYLRTFNAIMAVLLLLSLYPLLT